MVNEKVTLSQFLQNAFTLLLKAVAPIQRHASVHIVQQSTGRNVILTVWSNKDVFKVFRSNSERKEKQRQRRAFCGAARFMLQFQLASSAGATKAGSKEAATTKQPRLLRRTVLGRKHLKLRIAQAA